MCCPKTTFKDPTLPLAVVVAQTRWDEPPRMRHQVTRQLMRWCNVLFVEQFPDPRIRNRTGFVRHHDRLIAYAANPHCAIPVRLYANDPFTHGWVNRRFAMDIVHAVSGFGKPSRALLFNFVHDFDEIMRQPPFVYSVYVCVDEFPRMWRHAKRPNALKFIYQARLQQHYENQVARHADRCLVSHTPLRDKLSRINEQTTLFYHGHERSGPANEMPARRAGTRIRAAFMGYITYNLLLDWLEAVLNAPDIDLFLVGPLGEFDLARFDGRPNLHYVKPLTGMALQAFLADMDVLVMPYNPVIPEVHAQTVSNKFFQYVAAGRPIVISDMPHYIEMPKGVIYRAKTAEEFVRQIRQAYAEDGDAYRALRSQIAQDNTWDKRGDLLFSIINQDTGGLLTGFDQSSSFAAHGPEVDDATGDRP